MQQHSHSSNTVAVPSQTTVALWDATLPDHCHASFGSGVGLLGPVLMVFISTIQTRTARQRITCFSWCFEHPQHSS